ncbi:phosphotransferase enzyme family protein [Nocardioides aequoreus]|uniref:phosphotransferase enzyme family protein n=1 Tax=Nocardioides aequoreus TaxID=397278 RepID=UPI0004C33EAA|nr:phosphotransferase [Nocardioides aequoreus]
MPSEVLAPDVLPTASAELAERDPALPMLPMLLCDTVLSAWLSARLGEPVVARRRYLRYKAGTACLARVDVRAATGDPGPPRTMMLAHWADPGGGKLEKARAKAPVGTVLLADPASGVLVTSPAADRHLPALRRLEDPARRGDLLRAVLDSARFADSGVVSTTLAYKPHRRWVGRVTTVRGERALVRVYRPADLDRVAEVWAHTRALAEAGVPVSRLLGTHRRLGVAGVAWVPGHQLRLDADAALLPELGGVLARLHAQPARLPALPTSERIRGLRRTAAAGSVLLPHLAPRLEQVVGRATAALHALPPTPCATLHGDLSADQVVVGDDGRVRLIDLDRARTGSSADDLASLVATSPAPVLDALLAGYAAHAAPPTAAELAAHTAAQLLARATDGFRAAEPDWAERLERAVDDAEELL